MAAKRALVVDDSRSARAFLAKLLEEQRIDVEAAESAEQAIEYLARNRPDVIFMDHLMPGMDGFQAVQAIKSNPRTADIPVLMYTSQEGELYLGQARALGAVGVLPKNMEPADVRRALQQLDLGSNASAPTVASQREVRDAAVAVAATVDSAVQPAPQAQFLEDLLRDEVAALRQQMNEALAAQRRQLNDDLRALLREAVPPAAATPPPAPVPEPPRTGPLPWLLALAAGVAGAVFGTLWWHVEGDRAMLRGQLADSRDTISLLDTRLTAALAAPRREPAVMPVAEGDVVTAMVPFGEAPLDGARIELLREFVGRVAARGGKATVEVRRRSGRFCVVHGGAGYVLADAAMPVSQCALITEDMDPALGFGAPESVAFAGALAELRRQHGALVAIDVGVDPPERAAPYPEAGSASGPEPTAGAWNDVAEQNNRVVMRWLPAQ